MSQPLPGIDHVILLMFENRSFDNMLGAFYPGSSDRGGVPSGWSNPYQGTNVAAYQALQGSAAQTIPYPDPNELYVNMQDQIDNGSMLGFVADYATVQGATPSDIMQYYAAANVPVTSALAMAYAASDRYFASGPVQTWPNRLFSLCGTPGYNTSTNQAYLNNSEYPNSSSINGQLDYSSIFWQLDTAGASWKVYYDDLLPIAGLITYVTTHMENVVTFDNFFTDVTAGTLPSFSLIEPRYQMFDILDNVAPNSNHPGSSNAFSDTGVPISISCGEQLLANVFQALAGNSTLFAKTLLIVTYDEHGGLFDHVPPPPAVSPFLPGQVATGFKYDSYGVRVPALFINPYVQPGLFPPPSATALPAFDHTSILATLRDQFGLSDAPSYVPLSPRVTAAPTFTGLINPSQQPISPPTIAVPKCVWSPPSSLGHAEPIVRTMIRRGLQQGRSRER
ncbi:MAG: alkaline phosphatase family protein [Methylocella sp.]